MASRPVCAIVSILSSPLSTCLRSSGLRLLVGHAIIRALPSKLVPGKASRLDDLGEVSVFWVHVHRPQDCLWRHEIKINVRGRVGKRYETVFFLLSCLLFLLGSYLDDVFQCVPRRWRAVHLSQLLLVLFQLPHLRLQVLDLHAELDQQVVYVINAALTVQAGVSLLSCVG